MAGPHPVINISSSPAKSQPKVPPSAHRLPTVLASQALQDLGSHGAATVPSGLRLLDTLLAGSAGGGVGGLERGKTTEIWGPSGAGKTAMMLQTAVKALLRGEHVVWIDAATPLNVPRLLSSLEAITIRDGSATPVQQDDAEPLRRFHYHHMPSLSHLLALTLHPRPDFPPENTSLLVVDGLNSLIDIDFPRVLFSNVGRSEQHKWQAGRRYAVLGSLVAGFNKLAVLNNLVVFVSTGCTSRMRSDTGLGSALVPGIGGTEWDGGVWNRLVVLRDYGSRYVGLQKCQGRSLISREEIGEVGRLISFELTRCGGLRERSYIETGAVATAPPKVTRSPAKPRKRTFDEVADSEEEDVDEYGWADGDDHAIADEAVVDDQVEKLEQIPHA